MTDWWKKPSVPAHHKLFAASYRWGYEEGAKGRPRQLPQVFKNEAAANAYQEGYDSGKSKALEHTEDSDA